MLLRRRKRPRTKPVSDDRKPLHAFHQWLRSRECLVAGFWYEKKLAGGLIHQQHVCRGKTQVAHIRIGTDGGTGLKPADHYALPLCEGAHLDEQHKIGERTFWSRYGIDPLREAAKAFEQWQRETPAGQRYRRQRQERESA